MSMSLTRGLTHLAQLILTTAFAPVSLLLSILSSILNTFRFCLVAPFQIYLEPLEGRSKRVRSYEEWRTLQAELDEKHKVRFWSFKDEDRSYDWRSLLRFKEELETCRRKDDMSTLRGSLRAQAARNCCSMLSPRLYLKSRIQTKRLIHDYVREVRFCIERLLRRDSTTKPDSAFVEEEKRRLFSDVRQVLGRTTLVLQGGAMLSLCHLGVVRALHRRRLLPRIITATGTGALVGSIVGCTSDEHLLLALKGHSINVDAFARAREHRSHSDGGSFPLASWIRAIVRRLERFYHTGHFFEIDTLTDCVRENIGDITFEEAYAKTGRILNITIAKPEVEGTPQLLNYITTPHVVVWSAVAASVATSRRMFAAAPLKCKNDVGVIDRYFAVDSPSSSTANARRPMSNPRIPMERIGELFDVNHYIVSQTRPHIIPLVRFRDFMCQDPILGVLTKVIYSEVLHRLDVLNRMGLLPTFLQRTLIDEQVPSTSSWSKFVIAPELSLADYFRVFNFPSPKVIDNWAMKGERSVWPKICEIKIRCCVEFEVDSAYQREKVKPQTRMSRGYSVATNGSDR